MTGVLGTTSDAEIDRRRLGRWLRSATSLLAVDVPLLVLFWTARLQVGAARGGKRAFGGYPPRRSHGMRHRCSEAGSGERRSAMATIKARCPSCGEANLRPADLEVLFDADGASYMFRCPTCGSCVRRPADERVLRLLRSIGVRERNAQTTPAAPPSPPPFTPDDLLDFHELLEADGWFDRLLALAAQP